MEDSSGITGYKIYQFSWTFKLQRKIKYHDYSDQSVRLQSFKHWGGVLLAHELAEASFYMIACCEICKECATYMIE